MSTFLQKQRGNTCHRTIANFWTTLSFSVGNDRKDISGVSWWEADVCVIFFVTSDDFSRTKITQHGRTSLPLVITFPLASDSEASLLDYGFRIQCYSRPIPRKVMRDFWEWCTMLFDLRVERNKQSLLHFHEAVLLPLTVLTSQSSQSCTLSGKFFLLCLVLSYSDFHQMIAKEIISFVWNHEASA